MLHESAPSLPGYARKAVIDLVQSKPQFYPMPSWTHLSQLHGPKVLLQIRNAMPNKQSLTLHPIADLLTCSLSIQLLTSLAHSLAHAVAHSLAHLLAHLHAHLLARLLAYLTHLLAGLFTHLPHPLAHSFVPLFSCLPTHSLFCSLNATPMPSWC